MARGWISGSPPTVAGPWRCATATDCGTRTKEQANILVELPYGVDALIARLDVGRVARGDRITPVSLGKGSTFIGVGTSAATGNALVDDQRYHDPYANDWIDEDYQFFVAGLRLEAGVGPPGQDPATIQYPARVTLGADNSFSVTLPASAGATIYLRACHGTSCFYEGVQAPV